MAIIPAHVRDNFFYLALEFRLNFEITLAFVNLGCVKEVEQVLLRNFEHCRERELGEIVPRFRLVTRFARPFSPVL